MKRSLRWPIRDWRQLSGQTVTASKDQLHPEASLYLFAQHQPVTSIMLSLRNQHDERFNVEAKVQVNIDDLEGKTIPNVVLEAEVEASFDGLIVVPDNLNPKPVTPDEATRALKPFADVSAYSSPMFDEFRWIFRPKVS